MQYPLQGGSLSHLCTNVPCLLGEGVCLYAGLRLGVRVYISAKSLAAVVQLLHISEMVYISIIKYLLMWSACIPDQAYRIISCIHWCVYTHARCIHCNPLLVMEPNIFSVYMYTPLTGKSSGWFKMLVISSSYEKSTSVFSYSST